MNEIKMAVSVYMYYNHAVFVPVAQLDRALASGAETCPVSACFIYSYTRFLASKTRFRLTAD
jgi:hypothetical protein